MDIEPAVTLAEFTAFHDRAIAEFDHAMATGDTAAVEAQQADGYTVYFGRGNRDAAETIDREAATAGMRRSVADCAAAGIVKRWHHRLIRLAGPSEAAVSFEQVLERDGQVVARLLTMERWRRTAEGWRIVREMVEPVTP